MIQPQEGQTEYIKKSIGKPNTKIKLTIAFKDEDKNVTAKSEEFLIDYDNKQDALIDFEKWVKIIKSPVL